MPDQRRITPSTAGVVAAFAGVYVIWGSTYLAIRFAIESIPPFVMMGVRFIIAGALLTAWARWRGAARPTLAQWKETAIIGTMLLVVGNGAVVWAERTVPSGIAALLVAVVPLWIVLLQWLPRSGRRPPTAVLVGVALGLVGLALLVGPGAMRGGASVNRAGVLTLGVGSFSWALGSLRSRRVALPASPLLTTGMETLAAGLVLTLIAVVTGEAFTVDPHAVTVRSGLALLYLIIFGSLIGFSCYVWLLAVTTPARVSTYAYVNPVVAVLLGWLLAGEQLTPRMFVAAAVIVAAVGLITASSGAGDRGPGVGKPQRTREAADSREDLEAAAVSDT